MALPRPPPISTVAPDFLSPATLVRPCTSPNATRHTHVRRPRGTCLVNTIQNNHHKACIPPTPFREMHRPPPHIPHHVHPKYRLRSANRQISPNFAHSPATKLPVYLRLGLAPVLQLIARRETAALGAVIRCRGDQALAFLGGDRATARTRYLEPVTMPVAPENLSSMTRPRPRGARHRDSIRHRGAAAGTTSRTPRARERPRGTYDSHRRARAVRGTSRA